MIRERFKPEREIPPEVLTSDLSDEDLAYLLAVRNRVDIMFKCRGWFVPCGPLDGQDEYFSPATQWEQAGWALETYGIAVRPADFPDPDMPDTPALWEATIFNDNPGWAEGVYGSGGHGEVRLTLYRATFQASTPTRAIALAAVATFRPEPLE